MDPAQKHAIPYGAWLRGLSRAQAAAYAGVSENKFAAEVEEGLWPKPETRFGLRLGSLSSSQVYWRST